MSVKINLSIPAKVDFQIPVEKKEETLAAIEKIEQEYEIAIEKIREKRKRLKELYSKIPNLAEKKKNNSFTVRESKIVDEYEKLIFAELSAFENRYQKMLKLKEKIENNADKPESITVKKVSSGVMPIDKISRTLFNILENDDFYSHDKVLMNVGTVKKPIETGVIIKIDELKDVQFSRQLTYFDRAVANAVYSIYLTGATHFTPGMVFRAMNGESESVRMTSKDMQDKINESIQRLMRTLITIDATNENPQKDGRNKKLPFIIRGNLVYAVYAQLKVNGQEVSGYKFVHKPPLLQYSEWKKQINTYDINVLDTPLKTTEDNVILKSYLLERVLGAKNESSKLQNIILYDTIYKILNVEAENEGTLRAKKRDIRNKVKSVLNYWIEEKSIDGFIGFEELTDENTPPINGKKVTKIKLLFSTERGVCKALK